ncbi:MAG: CBS domain-containing protein [Proteobacteria bacterium]|nr:CBS domain-containing protein [Pseudomonadota bacterium]MBU1639645.1 CBS domain-containing protein [Pseudomonadota bacterium]
MPVGEFCNRQVVIASPESDIVTIAKLMREYHVGDVVIVQNKGEARVPVGIITDRDLVIELLAKEVDLDAVTVSDVMSYELVTCQESIGLWDALKHMQGKAIRRLVVVSDSGSLVGILTVDDILDLLADEMTSLAKVALGQQVKEKRYKS